MNNKIAFITGATSGIGKAFAEKFAELGYDLIVTGRAENKLNALINEFHEKYKIKVETINAELSLEHTIHEIAEKIKNLKNVEVLVNNAGFPVRSNFHEADIEKYGEMLNTHSLATMKFTHAVLPQMLQNKKGTIINVSSVAAFFPFPSNSVYSATKAFINVLTEALHLELKDSNIRFQVLCPGLTKTDLFIRLNENVEELAKKRGWLWTVMTPAEVVECSIKSLQKNKVICVPGLRNKILILAKNLKRFF
jgi:uncharacterized protein